MLENYETENLTEEEKNQMVAFLDKEIGTEYEVNPNGDETCYILILDLTQKEVEKVRNKERNLIFR